MKTKPSLISRDYVRRGAEGALAPPEFGGLERRTERETDNLLLLAPPRIKILTWSLHFYFTDFLIEAINSNSKTTFLKT